MTRWMTQSTQTATCSNRPDPDPKRRLRIIVRIKFKVALLLLVSSKVPISERVKNEKQTELVVSPTTMSPQ